MLVLAALLGGCTGPRQSMVTNGPMALPDVTAAAAVQAAEDVLVCMDFEIEKADAVHGVVRTRPLRSAQVFEVWRQDNATPADALEANLQATRKIVEIDLHPAGAQLQATCRVRVQQLSLPGSYTASASHAYQIHSRSTPTLQSLQLDARQQRAMAWIDLPDDAVLAQRILDQVAATARKSNPEGAQ